MPAPQLGFDTATGEVCSGCRARDDEIRSITSEKAVWIARCNRMSANAEKSARASALWPVGLEVFELWQAVTGKRRTRWTLDRFELIRPFLKVEGVADCKAAVYGLMESDWHVRHNALGWELVFSPKKDRQARFERFRDLGQSHEPDPFYVGTTPTLFHDANVGVIRRLRELVLALELSHSDKDRTAALIRDIHELTKGTRHDEIRE